MCISPYRLNNGHLVGCRLCWQCKEQTINDWVGRCIAESKTTKKTLAVTLTYGRDQYGDDKHINAMVLTYSDVQKFFKRLRKDGYKFRYFVVGEYGSNKGRAHWHAILFFKNKIPEGIELNKRISQKHWTHGYSYYEKVTHASVRYVCKYIFKDQKDEEKDTQLRMSKKPPLGHAYFQSLSQEQINAGLAPQDLYYSFPEVTNKKGEIVKFLIKGRSAENYLQSFIDGWKIKYGNRFEPWSQVVEDYRDGLVPEDLTLQKKIYKRRYESVEEALKKQNFARQADREFQYKLYIETTKGARKKSIYK